MCSISHKPCYMFKCVIEHTLNSKVEPIPLQDLKKYSLFHCETV